MFGLWEKLEKFVAPRQSIRMIKHLNNVSIEAGKANISHKNLLGQFLRKTTTILFILRLTCKS